MQVFTGSRLLCGRGMKAFDDLMVVVDKVTHQERKGKENDEWYMK